MKYMLFFATPNDIIPALRRFQQKAPLKFVDVAISTTPTATYFSM